MNLILLRHGIADDRLDPDCPPDFERRLTERGIRRTRAAAAGLRRLEVRPDLVLTSPLLRALETAEIAADELGVSAEYVRVTPTLAPDSEPQLALEEAIACRASEVMLVGHAPGLDLVLGRALGLQFAAVTHLKKAGAAKIELIASSAGRLVWLLEARALRQLGR